MKTRYIIVLMLGFCSLFAHAAKIDTYKDFDGNEKIYFNCYQGWDWSKDGAVLAIYVHYNDAGPQWSKATRVSGNVFEAKVPQGRWSHFLIVRLNSTGTLDWSAKWNQTNDMRFDDYANYVYEFWENGTACNWHKYAPAVSYIPNVSTLETQVRAGGGEVTTTHITTTSAGQPFSLRRPLNSAKTAYLDDIVRNHGWYRSTNGTSWTSVDSYAGKTDRDDEYGKDYLNETLPTASTIYYYLFSSNPKGQRLIKLYADVSAELTCDITSFETAISAVNADNNTFTLDGMVAFGKKSGNLVVECKGKSQTITDPKSPQTFQITGIDAATADGETTVVKAYFTGSASCSKEITINVPNATTATKVRYFDLLTGDGSKTLTPTGTIATNNYKWIVDGTEYTKAGGAVQTDYPIPAESTDKTTIFFYKEFWPTDGTMDDLMSNGSYEATDIPTAYGSKGSTGPMSDYMFWGHYPTSNTTDIAFYDHNSYTNGGFAVVRNAHNFYKTYATVTPRDADAGEYFALIDGEAGESGNKKAWKAKTTTGIKKGTTYVFSFWAANVNNYGEMENAARLQFQIKIGSNAPVKLGEVLDLGSSEFRNNIWHQCSSTYLATEDADDVEISVVNLNTNALETGNDFALDDIQFHAISSISEAVKSYQEFRVTYHEPKITAFTATPVQMKCDEVGKYTVKFHAEYQNPKGQIVIRDLTTSTDYTYDVPAVGSDWDVAKTFDTDIVITELTNPSHDWEVYFKDWTTASQTATTTTPHQPVVHDFTHSFDYHSINCDMDNYVLTCLIPYEYMDVDGTAYIWLDDNESAKAEVTGVMPMQSLDTRAATINVPADSANHTVHVQFTGLGENCPVEQTVLTQYNPILSSVDDPIVTPYDFVNCADNSYTVTATAHFRNIHPTYSTMLIVEYPDGTKDPVDVRGETSHTFTLPLSSHPDFDTDYDFKFYFERRPDCVITKTVHTPKLPMMNVKNISFSTPACTETTTSLTFNLDYRYQNGYLNVWVDDLAATRKQFDGSLLHILDYNTYTLPITIDNIPADGLDTHVLHVEFDEAKFCKDTYTLPTVPYAYKVDNVQITGVPAMVTCSTADYTATVAVTTHYNPVGKNLVIYYNDNGTDKQEVVSATGMTTSTTLTLHNFDMGALTIKAAYEDAPTCTTDASYTTPAVNKINPYSVTVSETACDVMNYTVSGTITYDMADGDLIVYYDDTHKTTAAADGSFTITGMSAEGTDLNLQAWFSNSPADGCKVQSAAFASPVKPTITVTPLAATIDCNNETYTQQLKIDYQKQQGTLEVWIDALAHKTVSYMVNDPTMRSLTVDIPNVPADGLTHKYNVQFSGACAELNKDFTAAQSPLIEDNVQVQDVPAKLGCSDTDYSANVVVNTKNYTGKSLIVKYADNGVEHTTAAVLVTTAQTTIPLTLHNINNGAQTVKVYFEGLESCARTGSYTAPTLAAINPYAVTVGATACGVMNYSVSGSISYDVADGDLVVEYDAAHKVTFSSPANPQTFTINDMTAEGTNLQLKAYFTGNPACYTMSNQFASPAKPTLTVTQTLDSIVGCNDKTYTLTLSETAANQTGSRFVKDKNLNTGVVTDVTSSYPTLTYAVPTAVERHEITIGYDGINDCSQTLAVFTITPAVPHIVQFDVPAVTQLACGDVTYRQHFSLNAVRQTGALVVELDGADVTSSVLLPTASDANYYLPDLTADGTSHTVRVHWDTGMCDETKTFITPVATGVTPSAPAQTLTSCDQLTYTQPVSLTIINLSGSLSVQVDDLPVQTVTYTENQSAAQTVNIDVANVPADGLSHTLKTITASGCTISDVTFTAPQSPVIKSVTINPAEVLDTLQCGQDYSIKLYIQVANATGKDLLIDGTTVSLSSMTYTAATDIYTYTLDHLTAVNDGMHTVTVQFAGYDCQHTATYQAPTQPQLLSISGVTVSPITCGETEYSVSGTVDYLYSAGRIIVEADAQHRDTISVPATQFNIKHITATGTALPLKAWFIGYEPCTQPTATFSSPAVPTMSVTATADDNLSCDQDKYTLTVHVKAEAQTGDLVLSDNQNGVIATITSPAMPLDQDFVYQLPTYPDDREIMLYARFTGATDCEDSVAYSAPAVPRLAIITPQPQAMACGESVYALDVNLTFENQTGNTLTIKDNGVEVYSSDTVTRSPFHFTTAKTLALTGAQHTLEVVFGLCTQTMDYDEPTAPACQKTTETICEGEDYTLNGFNILNPTVGTHIYSNGLDSLWLTVKAKPAINILPANFTCSTDAQITLPVTIAAGEPDQFSVTIGSNTYTANLVGTDLVFDKPADMQAGDYTATVQVAQTGLDCPTTTTAQFTIAQGDIVYSKWNGVLFVDNSDSLYTAYQWYDNGQKMQGETMQSLYNPDGLTGFYYCQMTTADGNTIYTCEYGFSDVPRSADVVRERNEITVAPNRVRTHQAVTVRQTETETLTLTLYDAVGKQVAQYVQTAEQQTFTAPAQAGIYILRITTDNTKHTEKLIVY